MLLGREGRTGESYEREGKDEGCSVVLFGWRMFFKGDGEEDSSELCKLDGVLEELGDESEGGMLSLSLSLLLLSSLLLSFLIVFLITVMSFS